MFYLSPDTGKQSGNVSTPAIEGSQVSFILGQFSCDVVIFQN